MHACKLKRRGKNLGKNLYDAFTLLPCTVKPVYNQTYLEPTFLFVIDRCSVYTGFGLFKVRFMTGFTVSNCL